MLTGSNVSFTGGGGIPGATVDVMDNGTIVGTTTVDVSGNWSYTTTLTTGNQAISVKQVDANGDVGPTSAPLAMTAYAVTTPTMSGPAGGGTVSTNTPTVSGSADAGSTVKLYDGTTLVGTTSADSSGHWSVTTSALTNGVNTLSATATNAQNVTSLVSGHTTITVAGQALAAPTYAGGSVISTTTVPLQGSGGIPGATVAVMDNGSPIGTATVTPAGSWSLTTTLAPGGHELTVRQIDSNGNVGPVSAVMPLSVQLPPPPRLPPPPTLEQPQLPPTPVAPTPVAPTPAPAEPVILPPLPTEPPPLPPTPVAPTPVAPTPAPAEPVIAAVLPVTVISAAVSEKTSSSQNGTTSVANVTSGGGFQVSLSSAQPANAVSDGSLFVAKGIPSLISQSSLITFTVPVDAFGHNDASASIQLSAKLSDGSPLPKWLRFDSSRGTFVGQIPDDSQGAMAVIVTARDNAGHTVSTTFRIEVGRGDGAQSSPAKPLPAGGASDTKPLTHGDTNKQSLRHTNHPVGKLAFTQQLKMAARNAAIRFF